MEENYFIAINNSRGSSGVILFMGIAEAPFENQSKSFSIFFLRGSIHAHMDTRSHTHRHKQTYMAWGIIKYVVVLMVLSIRSNEDGFWTVSRNWIEKRGEMEEK